MKDSFIIYTSFYEPIRGLSDKQLGRIFRALFDYHVTGDVQVDDDIKMAFLFFKNQMDIDAKKYTYICEKRKQAAVRGGAPKGNGNARKKAIESEENNQNNQMVEKTTKTTLNDNDNDNDNDLNLESSNEDSLSAALQADVPDTIDYKKFVDWFNSETKGVFGMVKYPIGDKRKASIRARVREKGKQSLFDVVKKAYESDFLKGNNQRGFVATLDWIIKPSNFDKILSDNYKNHENGTNWKNSKSGSQRPSTEQLDAAVEIGLSLAKGSE